jgi:hypothetical protein
MHACPFWILQGHGSTALADKMVMHIFRSLVPPLLKNAASRRPRRRGALLLLAHALQGGSGQQQPLLQRARAAVARC